jgi:hypothetical protein
MPSIHFLLNKTVIVRRRPSVSADALNAPNYGKPITWPVVYPALKCRIETNSSPIQFKPTGERQPASNNMYCDNDVDVRAEDRVYDGNDVWIVEGRQDYFNMAGGIHHYEFSLQAV